jgi:hypothetical protein
MTKLPWLKLRKKTAPELPYEPPIFLGNKSNGEFFHEQTPQERKIRAEILRRCDDSARKVHHPDQATPRLQRARLIDERCGGS